MRTQLRTVCTFLTVLTTAISGWAQVPDTGYFSQPVQMDTVVVRAIRAGWDVAGFIKRVRTDTTFYKAFRSMHLVPYDAANRIRMYDGNNKLIASMTNSSHQAVVKGCRTTIIKDEKTTGDFYTRKKDYNYYTAELFAYLFFPAGTACGENDIVAGALSDRGKGGLEKSKWQLKQLIFNPGSKVKGVPFMGDKAAIFEPEQAKKYDFKLQSEEYEGQECYLFQAFPKEEYAGDVVYNELSTWFRKSDYAIVARNYSLSYKTPLYDFNVRMQVRLTTAHGRLLPASIRYAGSWRVPTKGRERSIFSSSFSY